MSETLQMVLDKVSKRSEEWRNGPKISFQDLKTNSGNIEYISGLEGDPIIKTAINIPPLNKKSSQQKPSSSSPLMNFGKYKTETMEWVQENDENYFEWCLENIEWFESKATKAGLI